MKGGDGGGGRVRIAAGRRERKGRPQVLANGAKGRWNGEGKVETEWLLLREEKRRRATREMRLS